MGEATIRIMKAGTARQVPDVQCCVVKVVVVVVGEHLVNENKFQWLSSVVNIS